MPGFQFSSVPTWVMSTFEKCIELLRKHPNLKEVFYFRLQYISDDSRNFGWGYDHLYYSFQDFFKS